MTSQINFRSRFLQPITRRYPLLSGCTFPNRPFFHRLSGGSSETFWTRVTGGEIKVDLDDYVGRCAYFVGDLDRKLSVIFDRLIEPGDTVLDIGANIGLTTLRMAHRVGPSGRVHSFEPNPKLFPRLTEMVERNGLSNITLHAVALGPREDRLTLYVPKGNMGAASIMPERIANATDKFEVPVRPLDAVLGDLGAVKLIKIDVEGGEAGVLSGAGTLIQRTRPKAIIYELNSASTNNRAENARFVSNFLDGLGYSLFNIPRCLFRLRLEPLETKDPGSCDTHDMVALLKGETFDAMRRKLNAG